MALASFLAGALPLSMNLSSSQLRLISNLGMGVLVGTSLIVIIPEGIESIYAAGSIENVRSKLVTSRVPEIKWVSSRSNKITTTKKSFLGHSQDDLSNPYDSWVTARQDGKEENQRLPLDDKHPESPHSGNEVTLHPAPPTLSVGLSLILGFVLMFLIDKLPRHASENLQSAPPTRHISLSNLSLGTPTSDDMPESESFLHSLTPTPRQTRSLATTTGLVIHAAADGIAMGASVSSSNIKLGFVIFIAILIHKAPAAFGLTSVLLKQGLSKRAARSHLIIFSLATPLGALKTWLIITILGGSNVQGEAGRRWTGMLLLFSAGTFLYVAMHAMREEATLEHSSVSNGFLEAGINGSQRKLPRPQMRDTLVAVGGMLLPLLIQLGHHY
ncbi:hypothetical protein K3495_g4265 [Podosphaera aphanis]|nr:hypothetical protein K3495_g4265 [Podosphaera aphanis]